MSESFAELFEESLTRSNMKTGQVISAEVLRIDHNFVVVNAGLKSEAFIPVEEFHNDAGEIEVAPGDFVSVAIDALENGYGDTILSRDKAKRLASWMNLEKALVLTEVYPAGEAKIPGADGQSLMKAALASDKNIKGSLNGDAVAFAATVAEMPEKLSALLKDGDVLITMGAGSISGLPHALAEAKHV
jgi:hypothetical protein